MLDFQSAPESIREAASRIAAGQPVSWEEEWAAAQYWRQQGHEQDWYDWVRAVRMDSASIYYWTPEQETQTQAQYQAAGKTGTWETEQALRAKSTLLGSLSDQVSQVWQSVQKTLPGVGIGAVALIALGIVAYALLKR